VAGVVINATMKWLFLQELLVSINIKHFRRKTYERYN